MKVYIVMEDCGYEGNNDVTIVGIFSDPENAKEVFGECIKSAKLDMDEDWEFEKTENNFWACEKYRSSRNWINIWIAEREVE